MTYFSPALDPPLDRSGRKTTTLVRDHEYFIDSLPSFIKIHPAVLEKKSKMWKVYGRTRDGWTDGRRTVRYDNSSLEPSAQVSLTRAPRGTDRSPEYNEHFCYKLDSRVKNLTTEWNQKQQHLITHASRSLIAMNSVCCCSLSVWRRSFLKKETPMTYFAWPWIRPLANMAKTSLCMCRAMSTSSLPSFVNIH